MHKRISVNSICFMQDSLMAQAGHWRSLGAQRVSLLGPQLDAGSVAEAERLIAAAGCSVETIVHPFLPGQRLDPDSASWAKPRADLTAQIHAARQLGAKSIYMTTGGLGGLTWEQAAEVFAEAVAPCAELARSEGLALMIENTPPLYADLHIAHNLRDTVTLAEQAGIGVCIDIATCWSEAGLKGTIERAMPRCSLVQVSDHVSGDRTVPGRAVPGDGDVPLARLLGWILDAGYEGAFDLELLGPRIDEEGPLAATARAAEATGGILIGLGLPED